MSDRKHLAELAMMLFASRSAGHRGVDHGPLNDAEVELCLDIAGQIIGSAEFRVAIIDRERTAKFAAKQDQPDPHGAKPAPVPDPFVPSESDLCGCLHPRKDHVGYRAECTQKCHCRNFNAA